MPRHTAGKEPYQAFARIFDEIMQEVPYVEWVDVALERAAWAGVDVEGKLTILDACCGTGNVSWELARRGHTVTGTDLSEAMLTQARTKQANHDGVQAPRFVQADVRRPQPEGPYDLVTCLFDSLNYLPTEADLGAAFRAIAQALRPGGLFCFDVNSPARLRAIPDETVTFEGQDYSLIWQNRYLSRERCWEIRLTGFVLDTSETTAPPDISAVAEGPPESVTPQVFRRFDEVHREYGYSMRQIANCLTLAGLDSLAVWEGYSGERATRTSDRYFYLVRKPGPAGA